MRDHTRMPRPNLEGTGLCKPMGSRGTSPAAASRGSRGTSPARRGAPMKSLSHSGGFSARRGGDGATVQSLQRALMTESRQTDDGVSSKRTSNISMGSNNMQHIGWNRPQRLQDGPSRKGSVASTQSHLLRNHKSNPEFLEDSASSFGTATTNATSTSSANRPSALLMDASSATWTGDPTRIPRRMRKPNNKGDSSPGTKNATWNKAASPMDASSDSWAGGRIRVALRRTNTGESLSAMRRPPSKLQICGPDMTPKAKAKGATPCSLTRALTTDLFSTTTDLLSATVGGVSNVTSGVLNTTVDSVNYVTTGVLHTMPTLRRARSSDALEELRASQTQPDLSSLPAPALDEPFKAVKGSRPSMLRRQQSGVDDLESIASESVAGDGISVEGSVASGNSHDHNNSLRKPCLTRNQSTPDNSDDHDNSLSKPALGRNQSFPWDNDDHVNPLSKPALTRNVSAPMRPLSSHTDDCFFQQFDAADGFPPISDSGFSNMNDAFLPQTELRRNHSAPTDGFDDFSDLFGVGEPDWNPSPSLVREEPSLAAPDSPLTTAQEGDDDVGRSKSAADVMTRVAARRPLRRVKSTPKKVLTNAAHRARAKIQENDKTEELHETIAKERQAIQATSSSAQASLLAAANRAKSRVKDRRDIQATSPFAKKALLSSAQRARARVQGKQAINHPSTSEDKSPAARRLKSPLRKTRSTPANFTLDDSFENIDGRTVEDGADRNDNQDHNRSRDLSLASGQVMPSNDGDDDVGSIQASNSNLQGIGGSSARRRRDGALAVNRCRSRSPFRLRRANSTDGSNANAGSARQLNEQKPQQESALEARRRERKKRIDSERELQIEKRSNATVAVDHQDSDAEGEAKHIRPTDAEGDLDVSVSEQSVGGRPLSPKARARKGIQKIRSLMTSSPMRGRGADSGANDEQLTPSPSKQSPRVRRTSIQFIKDLVIPKKTSTAFQQMVGGDSSGDLPDLNKMDLDMSESHHEQDDSTAGETSSRSETGEGKLKSGSRDDSRQRKRISKSSTRQEKAKRGSESEKIAPRRKNSKPTESSAQREKRKSTDRIHAHQFLATEENKSTKLSEGISNPDRTSADAKNRGSKTLKKSQHDKKSSTSRQRKGSSRTVDGKSRRLKANGNRGMDQSESERSLTVNDLEMSENSQGTPNTSSRRSHSASANGSMSSSSRNNRSRNKSSSSSRSVGIDDSKARKTKRRSQSEEHAVPEVRNADEASSPDPRDSRRTSKSLCESLPLDTVPETYNEDDVSEAATPRLGRSIHKQAQKAERSPSASSSIQSTAEVSDSEEEFANAPQGRGSKKNAKDGGLALPRLSPAVHGARSSSSTMSRKVERNSQTAGDFGREQFRYAEGDDIGRRRRSSAEGEMRHSNRSSVDHSFEGGYYGGGDNHFHDPRQGLHGQNPFRQNRYPHGMQGSHHNDMPRWSGHFPPMHGDFGLGPSSHHAYHHSPGGFYDNGRHNMMSQSGHVLGARNWPNSYFGDPRGRMWVDPRGFGGRWPEYGGYRGGPPFYPPHPGMEPPPIDKVQPGTGKERRERSFRGGGSVRRRHSIGSGHDREAIMQEVSAAMDRELRDTACFRCNESMIECKCMEPIIDISHHSRGNDSDNELTAEDDGICYDPSDRPRAGRRTMPQYSGPIDGDMHAGNPHYYYGPPQPLYRRPESWDLNDYVHTGISNADRLSSSRNHRGRALGGVKAEQGNDNHGYRGARRSYAADDDSIRYPRRTAGGASTRSFRTVDSGGSGRSFF